ncbi:HGGxSTG domain-containing protein [Polynucleobacter sp. UB-Siik-W21]|uniref:HGGxSTG domain-containing protein n=1 Tax=Polynucleobacter sp. UB-Siik-W21 TaxID=1855646 RepID=UPI001BFEDC18|nr:HGGxSTG domain-containing protein [Polynucleobacter sp. UB-Siik-W21]QWD69658.1 hypothetical protein C2756_06950 [Polynucleobacter sp. UB-Siik-W21]
MTNLNLEQNTITARLQRRSKKCQITNPELTLVTAGGKIKCRRCVGVSSRTKQQCGHVALKTSKTSRCKWHSGASTGPRTEEGIEAIRNANTKNGSETLEARAERKKKFAELNELAISLGINPRK